MYFAFTLFWLTGLKVIIISLASSRIDKFRLIRTTFWTRKLRDKRPDESDDLNENEGVGAVTTFGNKVTTTGDDFRLDTISSQFDMQID